MYTPHPDRVMNFPRWVSYPPPRPIPTSPLNDNTNAGRIHCLGEAFSLDNRIDLAEGYSQVDLLDEFDQLSLSPYADSINLSNESP